MTRRQKAIKTAISMHLYGRHALKTATKQMTKYNFIDTHKTYEFKTPWQILAKANKIARQALKDEKMTSDDPLTEGYGTQEQSIQGAIEQLAFACAIKGKPGPTKIYFPKETLEAINLEISKMKSADTVEGAQKAMSETITMSMIQLVEDKDADV